MTYDMTQHFRIFSQRPNLTRLVFLIASDSSFAENVLHGNLNAIAAHPMYPLALDEYDRATVELICAQVDTVQDMLSTLAEVVDGPSPAEHAFRFSEHLAA